MNESQMRARDQMPQLGLARSTGKIDRKLRHFGVKPVTGPVDGKHMKVMLMKSQRQIGAARTDLDRDWPTVTLPRVDWDRRN